jgi:hypothetical protein
LIVGIGARMASLTTSNNDFTLGFQIKYCLVIAASLVVRNLFLYYHFLQHGLGGSYLEALVTLTQIEKTLVVALLMTFMIQSLLILLCTPFVLSGRPALRSLPSM